ncbi:unnamed protein product [Lota lota]
MQTDCLAALERNTHMECLLAQPEEVTKHIRRKAERRERVNESEVALAGLTESGTDARAASHGDGPSFRRSGINLVRYVMKP